ncbi:MAG: hypothetical protein IKY83_04595 [Proteobacteria bacterium]|nr:hypothetical protein [Pseudomonadota bacterium]
MSDKAEQAVSKSSKKDQAKDKKPAVEAQDKKSKGSKNSESEVQELFGAQQIDWNGILTKLQSDKKVRSIIANNQDYLNKIIDCNDAAAKTTINAILDEIYELISDEATMAKIFTKRFGVDVSAGAVQSDTKTMDIIGLKGSYKVLQKLPESHVQRLKALNGRNETYKSSSGTTWNAEKIAVDYDKNNMDLVESGAYTDKDDTMVGMNMFETTLAHEVGHVADTMSFQFSRDPEFLKISDWHEYIYDRTGVAQQLVNDMMTNMTDPLLGPFSDDELAAAKTAAASIIKRQRPDSSQDIIVEAFKNAGLGGDGNQMLLDYKAGQMVNTTLFQHIQNAFGNKFCWMNECFDYLPTRQFHQGYLGRSWWSYKNEARTQVKKNSRYQFRDPGEDYAELYATYFMGTPEKRKEIEPQRLAWFEKTVLPQVGGAPQQQAAQKPQQQQAAQKKK